MLEAKASAYKSAENIEALYTNAINAMKGYAGMSGDSEEDEN